MDKNNKLMETRLRLSSNDLEPVCTFLKLSAEDTHAKDLVN